MTKAGRPRALDETKKNEVCALISAGGSMRFAGRYVGCSAKTIRNEAQHDPDFGDRLRKSQLVAQLEPLRALRKKATTHWRAAAWLLERGDPDQFARQDQKFFKPQDVANLLENVRATLKVHIKDFYARIVASEVISRVLSEAGLPKGRGCAYAKLSNLPAGMAPDLFDPFQTSFPGSAHGPAVRTEETIDDSDATEPETPNLFSKLHAAIDENSRVKQEDEGKEQADFFPEVGTPGREKQCREGNTEL